ncbi:SIS domain-containing protein [Sphingomonas sp. SM33]|uniref:SIS domain-containing protein n=1 Tax=Sphingomonas telluris TaxID=2907998 RepID=A0ABS9VMB5_9SPHN|nr:SIS domain-containing protein [Sphingomonas telluris]MCH8615873.1 SIS domain-containing protein [Sphingomonas telluris]
MSIRHVQETRMFAEAAEAPAVVARQFLENGDLVRSLGERLRAEPPRGVITYARGSSDHAATFAKYVVETRAGVLTTSAAPSVSSVYGDTLDVRDMLALAISQSGRSPDILAALDRAKAGHAFTVAMVNAEGSPLSEQCDLTIPLRAGVEESVAATKSYIASLAAILHLVAAWNGDQDLLGALNGAPTLLEEAWSSDWEPLVECLAHADGLYVIGRGPGLGVAQEAALKLKETCRVHAEAFSAAEVRHGPMALVGRDFPVLVLRQPDETGELVDRLVRDMVGHGAPVFVAGGAVAGAHSLPVPTSHELIAPLLQIQAFYRAANALSLRRGLDPDQPMHLKKVTETL